MTMQLTLSPLDAAGHRRSWLAWPLAAAAVLLLAWLFWPGFMSPDSASQWAQARGGRYTDVHPPILALTLSLTERVWSGPGHLQFAAWSPDSRHIALIVSRVGEDDPTTS